MSANNLEKITKMQDLQNEARRVCQPHGCALARCLKKNGMQDCNSLMNKLHKCFRDTKRQLSPKFGLEYEQ